MRIHVHLSVLSRPGLRPGLKKAFHMLGRLFVFGHRPFMWGSFIPYSMPVYPGAFIAPEFEFEGFEEHEGGFRSGGTGLKNNVGEY